MTNYDVRKTIHHPQSAVSILAADGKIKTLEQILEDEKNRQRKGTSRNE